MTGIKYGILIGSQFFGSASNDITFFLIIGCLFHHMKTAHHKLWLPPKQLLVSVQYIQNSIMGATGNQNIIEDQTLFMTKFILNQIPA